MKQLCCRDVGVDCDFSCTGRTEEEVLKKAAKHAADAHGMKKIPDDKLAKVKAAIRDV
jgi:predicted small metal-binding protein